MNTMWIFMVMGWACTSEKSDCDVELELSTAHVAVLRWQTSEKEKPTISWQEEGGAEYSMQLEESSKKHRAELRGLPPQTEITYSVDSESAACQGSFETEALPPQFPIITVSSLQPERISPEPYFLGVTINFDYGMTLFAIDR
jgi:hypothetical protein